MKTMYDYSKEELQELFNNSISYAEVLRKMGYQETQKGGHRVYDLQTLVKQYDIDISNLLGRGHNKNQFDLSSFRKNNAVKSEKRIAVLKYLRGAKCEICGNTEWNGKEIPFCTHHIDGDHLNNELDNLQLLCPNCHAQTDNYCGKNKTSINRNISDEELITALKSTYSIRQALLLFDIKYAAKFWYDRCYGLMDEYNFKQPEKPKKEKPVSKPKTERIENHCAVCNKPTYNKKYCSYECAKIDTRKVERPSREKLKQLIRTKSFVQIGKDYKVSDNAIRKWCQFYNLPFKKKEINQYSNDDWRNI